MEVLEERSSSEPVVKPEKPKRISILRRYNIQSEMRRKHWKTFFYELVIIISFLSVSVFLTGSALIMYYFDGHSKFSRMLHVVSNLCLFGTYSCYWQSMLDGPPLLGSEDGSPIPAPYITKYV